MSYYQKYQKASNSRPSSQTHDSSCGDHPADFKKNSDSRQSYLKAFKKYYIEKLLENKLGNNHIDTKTNNKENFCFHQTHSEAHRVSRETDKIEKIKMSVMTDNHGRSRDEGRREDRREDRREEGRREEGRSEGKSQGMSRSKIAHLVRSNDCELQQLLYDSISQMQREMQSFGDSDLARQNKQLRASIDRLKLILKQKLQVALKRNKQELTVMFDEYSNMIRKLLQDKESLTNQLETMRGRVEREQQRVAGVQQEYENRMRIVVEENNQQIGSTKQQIEEFLDMIVQYEEEATQERQELEKLREKVVELQMENDRLKSNSFSKYDSSRKEDLELTSKDIDERYAEKIESLLDMLEKLQSENADLNHFLKMCKCSRIKSHERSSSGEQQELMGKYERKMAEQEKEALKEEGFLMEALRKKDECIDRLNLVIEELRKTRYASVDRMTEEALAKQLQ